MLKKLLKIKKTNKLPDLKHMEEEMIEEIHDFEPGEDRLPPIKLFLSLDQLNILKTPDEDRYVQAQMFLRSKEKKSMPKELVDAMDKRFNTGYCKLGNELSQCPHCKRHYQSPPSEMKKCLECGEAFFKTKRPQDGANVLVKESDRELISLQWENIKKAEQIDGVSSNQLETLKKQLEQRDNKKYTTFNAHFMYLREFVSKAIKTGRFRIYTSLVYYMAEHDRYDKQFTTALTYYFYLYYLQLNGASNSVVFGDKVGVNPRINERILSLLKMAGMKSGECRDFFLHSIDARSVFDADTLPYSPEESYENFIKYFATIEKCKEVRSEKTQEKKKRGFTLKKS